MSITWIVVETLAVLIQNFMYVFFLNSRFKSKRTTFLPQVLAWLFMLAWAIIVPSGELSYLFYDLGTFTILFIYLYFAKQGSIPQKIFGVMMVWVIACCSSIAGASLVSLFTKTSISHSALHQNFSRLLSIIIIKMMQVMIFYILSKKRTELLDLKRNPMIVLCCATVMDFVCIILVYSIVYESNEQQSQFLLLLALGLLFLMIVIFLMYELFIREEYLNIDLSTKLQRIELESHFFMEIDAMYTDMRTWRHEYKNNLTALRALAEHGDMVKMLAYIDSIAIEPERNLITLQTGNLVLDAVVSSKLWLAKARAIDVSVQAVYPESNLIEDNDLCAIAGNLLDNAIEACDRMTDDSKKKFITFSLLVMGKNLLLSICNSFNDELKREGDRYLTLKDGHFHGMGIPHVDSIVSKYQGHVIREQKMGIFETHIMLPLIPLDNINVNTIK